MEVHSHGLDALGVNKEANKGYSPELKDIGVPTSSQIPAGENFAVHTAVDTAAVNVNEELPKNAGVESNTNPNSGFSFPPASAAFNSSPDISFQHFSTAETGQDPQQEINQVPGQGVAFVDDMVILENDVVTVAEGAGHSHDEFHSTNVEMEDFHEAPVSDIYNDFSIPADDAVPEEYVDEVALDAGAELPDETTVTLTSDVTVVTTVIHEVTVVEPKEAVTDEAATDLPAPVENDPPSAPTSEDVEAKVPDATEDPVVDSLAVDVDTAQKSEPAGETSASQLVISEEEVLAIKGQKVVKKFGRKNFPGEVVDYDPETKWFKVVYEDGDDEDLELSEVKEILASSTKKKRTRVEEDADAEVSGKTTKKPRKTGSASTAKKSRSESDSAVKSPKTPRSKAKFPKSSKKSSVSKKVKSSGKPVKKSLNSSAFKTPAKSDTKEEKGKGKGKVATVTPKTKSGSSKKKGVKASRNLNLQSPKSQSTVKSKASVGSPSSKVAKASGSKRKVNSSETSTEKSKRSRKAAVDAGGDIDLVGKQVRKEFDGSLYDGIVVNFDKKTQFYKVKYTDGDQEDLELHEIEPILVQDLSSTDEKDDKPAKLSSLSSLMSAGTRKRK